MSGLIRTAVRDRTLSCGQFQPMLMHYPTILVPHHYCVAHVDYCKRHVRQSVAESTSVPRMQGQENHNRTMVDPY